MLLCICLSPSLSVSLRLSSLFLLLGSVYSVQAGFLDSKKNRLSLEVDSGAGGVWAGTGPSSVFPSLRTGWNYIGTVGFGYDRFLTNSFGIGVFADVGYGNVGCSNAYSNNVPNGNLSLRDRGFVEGGLRFSQKLGKRFLGYMKIGFAGHRMEGKLWGNGSGAGAFGTSSSFAVVTPVYASGVGVFAVDNNGGQHTIAAGTQIGVVGAGGIIVNAAVPSPSTGIMGYIANGNVGGVMAGIGPIVAVPGGAANGLVYNGGINTNGGTMGGALDKLGAVLFNGPASFGANGINAGTGAVIPVSQFDQIGQTSTPITSGNPVHAQATFGGSTGLEAFIANGNQIGTVNAQGVVLAAVPGGAGNGVVVPGSVAANGMPIGTAGPATTGGTTPSVSQTQTAKVTRSIGFFLMGLGLDYVLSNRLSIGLTGDVSFGARKTYTFTQGTDMFATTPTVSIRPTYARIMVVGKWSLN